MNYKRFQLNLIHLNTIDSTNNYAANLLKETNVVNGTTILTKRQENGRGQRGNSWHTEPDQNLILSTIIFPNLKSEHVFYLNMAVSLAVEKTLRDLGIDAKVKWPNDIYVKREKIAGILIENQIQGSVVSSSIIGLGLNVNQRVFPDRIKATSVALQLQEEVELMDIFNQLYGYLDFWCDQLMQSNFSLLRKSYYKVLFQFETAHYYKDAGGIFSGRITGVNAEGKLEIESSQGKRTYDFKEVAYLL